DISSLSFKMKKSYIKKISKTSDKCYKLIILECKQIFLPILKLAAGLFDPKILWIINSLPLKYYLISYKEKLNLNDLLEFSNLWLCFNNSTKKIYKKELIYLLTVNFNKYYTKYFYDMDDASFNEIFLFD